MERLEQMAETLYSIAKSTDSYRLIHADLHFWNFAVSPRGLTMFDFDNCEYNWFVADLGTALFEAATCAYQKVAREDFIKMFLGEFIKGYEQESNLGDAIQQVPLSLSCARSAFILFCGDVGRTERSVNFSGGFLSRSGWGW